MEAGAARQLTGFIETAQARRFAERGDLVRTERLQGATKLAAMAEPAIASFAAGREMEVFEHERLDFPSFPYEWPPEMLRAAGELTIELAAGALQCGFGIKDATPFNVLFRGPKPVFVDLLSFEQRDPLDPTWLPYAQFVRTFLLPLFLSRHNGLDLRQIFLASREGIEPAQAYRLISARQRLMPPFLGLASIPTWLAARSERHAGLYSPRRSSSSERARFTLDHLLSGASSHLRSAAPDPRRASAWTDYTATEHSAGYTGAKKAAVASILESIRPSTVLDAGSNTGEYSIAAAQQGAQVVAIDFDPAVAGRLWTTAAGRDLNILPLVANLAQPSPPLGWLNAETPSLLDRLEGRFDCILMLAVIHHLLVTERVPLEEIAQLAARLTSAYAVIEFVGPTDEHFLRIARGRASLHSDLSPGKFETVFSRRFSILKKQEFLGGDRCLYLLKKT